MSAPAESFTSVTPSRQGRSPSSRRSFLSLVMLLTLCLPTVLAVGSAHAASTANANANPEFKPYGELLAKKKPKKPERSDRDDDRDNDNRDRDNDSRGNDEDDYREGSSRGDRLSPSVINVLRRDLSQRIGLPPGKIKALETQRVRWPDSCLGLRERGEYCGQTIVEGWRVVLTANGRRYVYRTDLNGRIYRLEGRRTRPDNDDNQGGQNLPTELRLRVLRDAAQRTGRSIESIRIVQAEQRTWSDGCLGLPRSGEICTLALVQGWRIVVSVSETRLIYRTNSTGSVLRVE